MKMKWYTTAIIVVVLTLAILGAVELTHIFSKPEPVAEVVSHVDTSAIELWCGDFSEGNIRMVGAWVAGYKDTTTIIEDETGNFWKMEDVYIDGDEFILLWIADNHTPKDVKDDLIIKLWIELH